MKSQLLQSEPQVKVSGEFVRFGGGRPVRRSVLATAARLTARRASQRPEDELAGAMAREWYRRARSAGIPKEELRDAISGASGADFLFSPEV